MGESKYIELKELYLDESLKQTCSNSRIKKLQVILTSDEIDLKICQQRSKRVLD